MVPARQRISLGSTFEKVPGVGGGGVTGKLQGFEREKRIGMPKRVAIASAATTE